MDSLDILFSKEGIYSREDYSVNKVDSIYILLFKKAKHDVVNKIITMRTGFDYTHSGISITRNLSQYYDMMPEGVRYFDGKQIEEDRDVDVYRFAVTKNQKNMISNLLKEFINRDENGKMHYDFKSLFSILFGFTHRDYSINKLTKSEIENKDSYICSAFVAGVLAAVSPGIKNYIMKTNKELTTINPGEISKFPGLSFEYRMNMKTKKKEKSDG